MKTRTANLAAVALVLLATAYAAPRAHAESKCPGTNVSRRADSKPKPAADAQPAASAKEASASGTTSHPSGNSNAHIGTRH